MNAEIHLFIIWSKAMAQAKEIIVQISTKFVILDIFLIRWSPSFFSNNLSRFYGTNLPDGSFKEKHCGRGDFCMIIVRDPAPVYDVCDTTAGKKHVNTNMFNSKQIFRHLTGGGHRIHGTNTPEETDHDLMLLLEMNTAEYVNNCAGFWDGQVKPIEKDFPGANGWESIEQFFKILNSTTSYVVLRNFECLPRKYNVDGHGDIDLLCENLVDIRFLSNAKPVFNNSQRVLHTVRINNKDVLFDFRYIGDNYYDIQWQKAIIKNRVFADKCYFRPSIEDYFYSLLYHAAIHKLNFRKDYIEKLCSLSKGLENLSPESFETPNNIKLILDRYLKEKGYRYTEPADLSVFFNNSIAGQKKLSLDRIFSTSTSLGTALYRILCQSSNRTTNSHEFSEKLYKTHPILKRHFSHNRYAIFESISLSGINSVLEIGAESGVLTRYLGERFKHVVAIENEPELAQCVKIRCTDLRTVSVISDIQALVVAEKQFDLIYLNGDCETWFHQQITLKKIAELLIKVIKLLAPGGLLIFAVDNPLSKTGFFGSGPALNFADEPIEKSLKSLSVHDIQKFLISKGLDSLKVFYMFPDHIIPKTIISQEAEMRRLRSFGYWAASACDVEEKNNINLISAGEMSCAGSLGHLAGGLCIMATDSRYSLPDISWQIFSTKNSARAKATQTTTKVMTGDNLVVVKEGQKIQGSVFAFDPDLRYPLFEGCQIDAILMNQILSGSLKRVLNTFQQIVGFWIDSFEWKKGANDFPNLTVCGDREIIGNALDAIPRNLIISIGKIRFFDDEWKSLVPLPLSYLLYRSVLSLFNSLKPKLIIQKLALNRLIEINTIEDVIVFFINQLKLFPPLNLHHVAIFQQFEQRFQDFACYGKLSDENPSLLELYQRLKADLIDNDLENINIVEKKLKKHYRNMTEVKRLLSLISQIDTKKEKSVQAIVVDKNSYINKGHSNHICQYNTKRKGPKQLLANESGQKKDTTIIILVRNQLNYTKKCIGSIMKYTDHPFDLIVVDNGSKDGTRKYLQSLTNHLEMCDRFKVINNNENLGFASGNNQGIAAARGEYILLMNNDTVVTPGWLDRMISCMERNPGAGIVGPKSNYVSGPQLVENVDYNTKTLAGLKRFSMKLSKNHPNKDQRLLRVVGFCMLIKRSVIDTIGGLDDRYGLGNFEDDDFSLRAAFSGFESWMVEDCFIHHFGNKTFIGEKIDYRKSLHKNWEIFKEKWGLPPDLPYGSPYSLSQMKIDRFDPTIHYIPLPVNETNSLKNCSENLEIVDQEYSIVLTDIEKEDIKIAIEKLQGFAENHTDYASVYNDMGILFLKNGGNNDALKNFQKAVDHEPKNITFQKNLADLLAVEFGEYEEALQHYVAVLASDPKDIEALLATGHICARLERYDDAAEFYEKVLEIEPNNSAAIHWLGNMRDKEATNGLERNLNERYQTLITEIDHEDIAGTIQKIENFIEMYPKHGQAHNDLGVIYYKNESKTKVLACYLKAVELEPENVTFRKNLADFLYVEEGRVEEALENYVEVLRIKPDDVEILLITGHICTAIERFEDAMSFYHKVIDIEPTNLDARQNMEALKKRQILMLNQEARDEEKPDDDPKINQVESHASIDEMTIENAGVIEELINKAELLFQQERIDQAVDTLLKAIAFNPSDGRTYIELAGQLVNHGRHKNALEVLAEMPANQPEALAKQKLLLEGLGQEGIGNYAAAKKCSDSVLDREPENAKAMNLNGILAYRNGDKETADQYFKRAIELDSEYGEPHTNLGALVWEKGESKMALELYERGFSISPTDIDVANAYHEAVSATGEYKRAERVARSALKKYPQCRKILYLLVDTLIRQEKNEEVLKELETALSTFGIDEGLLDTALAFRERVGKIQKTGLANKPGVSLCMIVKDEEANLARCLSSVKPIVDEMVIVDTGSIDRTKAIAEFFGAHVFDFEWNSDFSAARNFSLSKAKGRWILIMDADEVISPKDYGRFRKLVSRKTKGPEAYSVVTRNYCFKINSLGWTKNDGKYAGEEAGSGWLPSEKVRLFRGDNEICFEGAVHEMVDPVLKRMDIAIEKCFIPVHHYGSLNPQKLDTKGLIYYKIGRKKLAEKGNDMGAVRELAIQATILERNTEAIELWQRLVSMGPGDFEVAKAFINIGTIKIRMKDYGGALAAAMKAVKFGPSLKESNYNLALAELYSGNASRAIGVIESCKEIFQNYPPALFILAAARCCSGDDVNGIKELQKLKNMSLGSMITYSCAELADGLISAGELQLALRLLKATIESGLFSKNILDLYTAGLSQNELMKNSVIPSSTKIDMSEAQTVSN